MCVAATSVAAQDRWRDTTHHTAGFVTVQRGVKIHYLDFGGTGPTLLFVPGLGNTAHAWDTFAPAFADRFHVVAVTRRGFGESSHPAGGYDQPRLVADLLAVIDSLHLGRVSIVGHSIAGEEMTRIAAKFPSRVDRLVYLDGAYDRVRAAVLVGEDSVEAPVGESIPPIGAKDTANVAAYVRYVHASRGVDIPEADIRTRFKYDGWNEALNPAYSAVGVETPDYAHVRAPALAIYAVRDDSDELYAMLRDEFRKNVTKARVLEIHGAHHWIFLSNREQVLSATRAFLIDR